MANIENTGAKAKSCVFRLLKFRPYSEEEVRVRLGRKKFDAAVIKETIQYFKEIHLIDDRLFAQRWISERMNKPLGRRRILFELRSKGIDEDIIREELADAADTYAEEDIAAALARKQAGKYKNLDPRKVKQRVCAFLLRRGFDSEAIEKALRTLTDSRDQRD